jgi:hypothetical protein
MNKEIMNCTNEDMRYICSIKDLQNSGIVSKTWLGRTTIGFGDLLPLHGALFSHPLSAVILRIWGSGTDDTEADFGGNLFSHFIHIHFVLCRKANVMSHVSRTISFVSCILSAPSFIFTFFCSAVRRQDVRQRTVFWLDFL